VRVFLIEWNRLRFHSIRNRSRLRALKEASRAYGHLLADVSLLSVSQNQCQFRVHKKSVPFQGGLTSCKEDCLVVESLRAASPPD